MRQRNRQKVGVLCLVFVTFLAACGGGGGGASNGGGGGAAAGGGEVPEGPVAAGLQPVNDGWSFPNYPSSSYPDVNFDASDLVAMFGADETICIGGVAEPCELTAEAAAWARMVNQARASGHCEGLVALASSRFNNKETPATVQLPTEDETLHAIMRAFATQFIPEVQDSINKWMAASLEEKVAELKRSLATGKLEYTLGVYVAEGGHAVLPYAVEYPSPDVARIMVYDSNWPAKNRFVDVDLKAQTWTFSFSGEDPENDPAAWTGGPADMDLTPFSARQGTCPFCGAEVKVTKNTMLIRTTDLDWEVETDSGTLSPGSPETADGASVTPVKGGFSSMAPRPDGGRSSYNFIVQVPVASSTSTSSTSSSTSTTAVKKKSGKAKMKFKGAASVFALMPTGIASFTTPGGSDQPVEVGNGSVRSSDPSVDLTLASGNLVANASGSSAELVASETEMEVTVTAPNGQIITQSVNSATPVLQMKADPESGGVTVLAQTPTGEVEKTEVAPDGTQTKTIEEPGSLDLNKVEVELPKGLESKPIESLPPLENRNLSNPNYKPDTAYVAPTTVPSKTESGGQVAASATTVASRGASSTTVAGRGVNTASNSNNTASSDDPVKPKIGDFRIPVKTFGDDAFTLDPPESDSSGGFRFTSSKPEVATVALLTGRVTIVGAGTTTITATQSAVKGFTAATATATLVVGKATPELGTVRAIDKTFGDEAFVIKPPTSDSKGAFSFDSSNDGVIRINATTGRATISGAGRSTITMSQAVTDDHVAASRTVVVTVKKGTPTLGAFPDVSKIFGDAPFDLSEPTSDSKAAFSFTSSNGGVASVSATGRVTVVGAGTTTITANQAANDDWVAASKQMTLTVAKNSVVLSAGATISKKFGDAAFTVDKPSSASSGEVTFASDNANVLTIDAKSGLATIVGAGEAKVTISQAATANHEAASVTRTVTVAKAPVDITGVELTDLIFGAADSTLAPKSPSRGTFTYRSSNTRVLEVSDKGVVKVVGVGTATITVSQAATANYEAGSASVTVRVGRATPSVQRLDPIEKAYGDAAFTFVWGTSPSDGAITYRSSNTNVATINATTGRVTIVGVGEATLSMEQAESANYNAVTVTARLVVARGNPVFGDFVIDDKPFGSPNFVVTPPISTSTGVFSYTSSNLNVATINAITGEITIVGQGSTTIRASQAATTLHLASSIATNFTVGGTVPTIGTFSLADKTFGDAPYVISNPTSNSSGGFSYASSNEAVATIHPLTRTITIVGAGSTIITATQAAAAPFASRSVTATLTVAKATPVLTSFGSSGPGLNGKRYVGYFNDNVNWFATAPLHGDTAVTTSFDRFSSSANYSSQENYSWEWTGVFRSGTGGTYRFCTASDDASYLWLGTNAASGFTTSNSLVNNGGAHGVRESCGDRTLSANTEYDIRIQFGEAGGGDEISVYFTPPAGASTRNGSGYYFTTGSIIKNLSDAPFTPTLPTSNSPASFVYSSSNESVATMHPTTGLVTIVGTGTTTLTASQPDSANFTSATGTVNLNVLIPPTLGAFTLGNKTIASEPFTPTPPTSDSGGTWSYASSNTNVATVNSSTGQISIVGGGTTTITATQARTSTHDSATATATLTIDSETVTALDGGEYHTCALTAGGAARCWGYNNFGQLGDGTTTTRSLIGAVSGLSSGVVDVSAGYWHSCAVLGDGTVKCWGRNDWGNLGDGTNTRRLTPVTVSGITNAVEVVALMHASCALLSSGAVKCWGHGGYGELGHGSNATSWTPVDVVGLGSGVTKISGTEIHACALTEGGSVKCWGNGGNGRLGDGAFTSRFSPTDVIGLDSGAIDIAAANYSTCAVTGSGGVKCWGHGGYSEQGNGSTAENGTPVDVTGATSGYVTIHSGQSSYCAIDYSGAVKCWGRNDNWQLGDGTQSARNVPVSPVGFAGGVKSMGMGDWHSCALFRNGTVKCVGRNTEGQLGDKSLTNRSTPVIAAGAVTEVHTLLDTSISALSVPSGLRIDSAPFVLTAPTVSRESDITYASSNPSVATIDPDTRTVTIVGRGTTLITATVAATSTHAGARTAVAIRIAENEVTAVTTGYHHSCAVTASGAAKCWGLNDHGQLGNGSTGRSPVITQVSNLTTGVAKVATGVYHSCAVTTAGAAKCWGRGDYGQLGENSSRNTTTPVDVTGLGSGVVDIAPGHISTCALTAAGGVKCWGDNAYGQLGDGTTTRRHVPVDVIGLQSGVVEVVLSNESACALLSAGAVKCWGYGANGEIGDGTSENRTTPRLVSGMSSGVVDITAGRHHFCAVTAAGAAKCWGFNDYGQIGDGSNARRYEPTAVTGLSSGVASISGGVYHTCVLTTAGGVKCWGHNDQGQLGDGTRTRRYTPVDVSGLGSGVLSMSVDRANTGCAITGDGKVRCWGYNAWGQLGDATNVDRITPVEMYNTDGAAQLAAPLGALTLPGSGYTPSSPSFALATPSTARAGSISFFSSHPNVATVNSSTGQVTIVGSGRTVLAAVQGGTGTHRVAVSRVTLEVEQPCADGGICEIGDTGPGGGTVFFVDTLDEYIGFDYLEIASIDEVGAWCDSANAATSVGSARNDTYGGGVVNTRAMLANCDSGAATTSLAHRGGGKSDWYLPTRIELSTARTNLAGLTLAGASFTDEFYWTSYQSDTASFANVLNPVSGATSSVAKTTATLRFRPVRAFAAAYVPSVSTALSGFALPSSSYNYGTAPFATTAPTSLSSGIVTYTSSNTSVATIHPYSGKVTIVAHGSTTFTATQGSWGTFAALTATQNFTVNKGTPVLSGLALPGGPYRADDPNFTVVAPTTSITNGLSSSGVITYASSNPAAATIDPDTGLVDLVAAGTTTITATQAAQGSWNAATQTVTLAVGSLCKDGGECRVGDEGPGGGTVFYVDSTNTYTTLDFMEISAADVAVESAWCAANNGPTLASAVGTGQVNTTTLLASEVTCAPAVAADGYANSGETDWYLPSQKDLELAVSRLATKGISLPTGSYWTSSNVLDGSAAEIDSAKAVAVTASGVAELAPVSSVLKVRAVRSWQQRGSCQEIKTSTGANTNGMYNITASVNGVATPMQVYCLMDSAMDGGGWTLVMKAGQGSTTFPYSSNYWTTANTLNASDTSLGSGDAKYDTFNHLAGSDLLAVFPDVNLSPFGATERGSVDGHNYGWTWKQSVPGGPKTALALFGGSADQYVSLPADFAGWNGSVFSAQQGFKWYGFNYSGGGPQLKVRWGFGWNNEGDQGSNDTSGGIGLSPSARNYSAGDVINCCQSTNGLNRSMAVQIFVR